MIPDAQNIKTRPDALGNAKNEFGRAKRDSTPSDMPKMSLGAENMKTGPDALNTAENESSAQNVKTGLDALGTARNESRSIKHEDGT
jgi:hypothetical protein